jgi:hypothetical protein
MKICCDVIKTYMTDLICDNADKTKIDAVFVDGNYLCVLIIQYRYGSNSKYMYILTVSVYTILMNADSFNTLLIVR